CQQNTHWPLTF
nr:immunoglobulin light chain junction region [Macaca mulatta]